MKYIDFRSDTVTQPTKAMRLAMMNAEVGDNVLGEDPTVIELEEYSAELFNKEAALFVLSGTMANQIAVMTLTNRGDEIILSKNSHMYNLEVAALATLSQVQAHPIGTNKGKFNLNELESAIRKKGIQNPKTSLIALENTYDLNRGLVLDKLYLDSIKEVGVRHNLPVYLDGARVFNAATALNIELSKLTESIDALQFCLTKGLAAPIGSILVGSKSFIEKAKWIRQRIGGGMRQAGHIAAAGLVAIKDMRKRLTIDHENAIFLTNKLREINPKLVDLNQVQSNIIKVHLNEFSFNALEFSTRLLENSIKVKVIGKNECRMIIHK